MKKLTALFLVLALAVVSLPAFAEGGDPIIPAASAEISNTGNNSADIEIKASVVPYSSLSDTVLYFSLSWRIIHALYARSTNYTWDPENLVYVEDTSTVSDWTCIRDYAKLEMGVTNSSNVPLTVTQSWTDGEKKTDLKEFWDGNVTILYLTEGTGQWETYSGAFEIASAAPDTPDGIAQLHSASMGFRVDTVQKSGNADTDADTVAAADLSAGVEVFGTATVSIAASPASPIRES